MKKVKAMREEWSAGYQTRKSRRDGRWKNAKAFNRVAPLGPDRYYSTKAEAKAQLDYVVRTLNSARRYDADGNRIERHTAGFLSLSVVVSRDIDADEMVVATRLRRRMVTEWECVDESEVQE